MKTKIDDNHWLDCETNTIGELRNSLVEKKESKIVNMNMQIDNQNTAAQKRRLEAVEYFKQGFTIKQIAELMRLSIKTIYVYLYAMNIHIRSNKIRKKERE